MNTIHPSTYIITRTVTALALHDRKEKAIYIILPCLLAACTSITTQATQAGRQADHPGNKQLIDPFVKHRVSASGRNRPPRD